MATAEDDGAVPVEDPKRDGRDASPGDIGDGDGGDYEADDIHTTMCSVLNVVIDHTMEPVTPLEEEEWIQQQQQQQRLQRQRQHRHPAPLLSEEAAAASHGAHGGPFRGGPPGGTNGDNPADGAAFQLLVPVIRIFGPVLRGPSRHRPTSSSSSSSLPPLQSACLYVHGAFPYLLARPVAAGPDGGLNRAGPRSAFIDWDDAGDVGRIAADLHRTLEETLQALDLGLGGNNGGGGGGSGDKTKGDDPFQKGGGRSGGAKKRHPIVRRVTVVKGRGFYTYCPGPSAPFLRVEYYDPKLRWKVKLVLEKGLEVPLRYHPDPHQYDRMVGGDGEEDGNSGGGAAATAAEVPPPPDDPLLRFHCYEAHIPYTMQFFKDHNLAGMAYLHLRGGRIRGRLPERYSPSLKQNRIPLDGDGNEDVEAVNRSVFLRSNTPPQHLWSTYVGDRPSGAADAAPKSAAADGQTGGALPRVAASRGDDHAWDGFSPPPKNTSCDVEIDCTVRDIGNVDAVLTTMPSDQDERDRIQWRAVPSLQEIWREERRRMDRLLSPKLTQQVVDDVLAQTPSADPRQEAPAFTLNVKGGAPRSGARLAVRGMWALVSVTAGLPEDFVRALSDILRRHVGAIEAADDALRRSGTSKRRGRVGPTDSSAAAVGSRLEFSPATPSNVGSVASNDGTLTPSVIEAICALETLGSATPGSSQEDNGGANGTHLEVGSPSFDEAIGALQSLAEATPGSNDGCEDFHTPLSPQSYEHASPLADLVMAEKGYGSYAPTVGTQLEPSPSQPLSQPLSYQSSQEMHDRAVSLLLVDPVEFSQRIDRGDAILEFQDRDVEDLIDPETLAPYDHIDFGEDRCRAVFAVETDPPNLQRVCGFRVGSCARDGHFYADERARPGVYRTVTTGAVVDGVIDTSKIGVDDEDDGDDNDVEEFCRLSQDEYGSQFDLATQPTQTKRTVQFEAQPSVQYRYDEVSEIEEVRDQNASSEDDDDAIESNQIGTKNKSENSSSLETEDVTPDGTPNKTIDSSHLSNGSSDVEPPTRGLLSSTIRGRDRFLAPSEKNQIPDWLPHAAAYMKRKSSKPTGSACKQARNITSITEIIQPTIVAPSRQMVLSWTKREFKGETTVLVGPQKRKRETTEVPRRNLRSKNREAIGDLLEIDANSRKLVPKAKNWNTGSQRGALDQQQNIEEVTWESSQQWHMTPTQYSQNEIEEGEKQARELGKESARIPPDGWTLASLERSECSRPHTMDSESQPDSVDALDGIGNQGGRIHVQGGGGLKARTKMTQLSQGRSIPENEISACGKEDTFLACPISIMSVEVHVQCREGTSRLDSKKISMAQDSSKDRISAIVFAYARDPGGGESIEILLRGCICTTLDGENPGKDPKINRGAQHQLLRSIPRSTMGVASQLLVEVVEDERHLLRRFKDIVRLKDPDMIISWDTQGAGLGYMIERGVALGKLSKSGASSENDSGSLDMAKLLGRTPTDHKSTKFVASVPGDKGDGQKLGQDSSEQKWTGSGLGSDWDDKVGAGAAAASIVGRLIFSGWKLIAEEVKHANASYLPAVVAAVLNKRIPYHDDMTLTKWYSCSSERWRVLSHRLTQATASLLLFDALDIVGRAGEAARLSGVEFSQSFPGIRGSQYKVEGVLLRALQSLRSDERGSKKGQGAHSLSSSQRSGSSSTTTRSQTQSPWKLRRRNAEQLDSSNLNDRQYFFFSPSLQDTNKQEALEVQAMTLEPQSGHYSDPVVVCDFTALYPSLIIAYNLCYSTCAGKLDYHSTRREMQIEGKTRGRVGPINYPERRTATVLKHHMKSIAEGINTMNPPDCESPETDFSGDRVYVAPTGTIYLAESVLKGVLPQVLDEILTTRAMLKRAAQEYKKGVKNLSPAILRQLEARQLALKYVANVTYGYTSATFSGRCAMPLLADAIVECGRRTLRRAMDLANRWGQGTDPWGRNDDSWLGAKVIYGDTDSLFIKMPGRTYKEAFEFGEKLCAAVTSLNPPPVQLKLEKVYLGSIIQTMKRYCGMKFESKNQKKPVFEAKGLETIRRDQCALTQKVLKNALITLFKHGIDAVKEYLFRQWSSIFAGQIPVSDFILTGRVRSKYRGGKEGPVQAVLARRLGEADPGRIVRHKERLPYVIVATPGMTFRLKDCVLTPMELLERWDAYKIHAAYYIERHVNAALQRCLGLAPHFVKVADWFQACPKPRRRTHFWPVKSKRAMITAYFGNDICSLCQRKCQADGSNQVVVCKVCRRDKVRSIQVASKVLNEVQDEANVIAKECSRCNGCFESADTFAVAQPKRSNETGSKKVSSLFGSSTSKGRNNKALLLPLANCVCIDCPVTFRRHRLREQGIQAEGTYNALTSW